MNNPTATPESTRSKPTVYLVSAATRNRAPLFADLWAARHLIREMRRLHDGGEVISLAWVLLPTHLHWLIATSHPEQLGNLIQRLTFGSASAINRHLQRSEPVWNPIHRHRVLRPDQEILHLARQMLFHPLKNRIAKRLEDFPAWDSAWV